MSVVSHGERVLHKGGGNEVHNKGNGQGGANTRKGAGEGKSIYMEIEGLVGWDAQTSKPVGHHIPDDQHS